MPYTDEELVESLRQLTDQLGETPTSTQCNNSSMTPSAATYANRFGSWNGALEVAGLSVNERSYTDDELIAALREFAGRLGETPTYTQVTEEPEMPSTGAYQNCFGSWNTALEEAGLTLNRQRSFSDEELILLLQELATELGHTPTTDELDTQDEFPSSEAYRSHFDTWNDALREARLTPNRECEQHERTDKELLCMLRELDAQLDTSLTMKDIDSAPGVPCAGVFADRFGGWNEAKQRAGLSTHDKPNQYTDTELLQELQHISQAVEKPLTIGDLRDADAACLTTYQRRFGSWSNALDAAGLAETQQPPTE